VSAIQKAERIYLEKGLIELVKRLVLRGLKIVFETNSGVWYQKDLSKNCNEIDPRIPVTIDFFSADKTIKWLQEVDIPWVYNQQEIDIGMKEGHYFPHVKHGDSIIGYIKVGRNNVYIADYKKSIGFPRDVAFIYDTYILPEYRNLNIASFAINEVSKFLKNQGFKKVMCHIPSWNIPSIRAYTKVGFEDLKKIRWIKIFGVKLFTTEPTKLFSY